VSGRRVLYLHHPFVLGGSSVSLLYLLQQLDRERYEPVVACLYDAPEVVEFYRAQGFRTVVARGRMFSHTTAGWWPLTNPLGIWNLLRWGMEFRATAARLRTLLAEERPDVVHLNSLTLAPFAPVIRRAGVPVVMHVRESVHPGHLGARRAALRRLARRGCDEVVYICHHDQDRLTGAGKGTVIYNFVDFERFDRDLDGGAAREGLGLRAGDRVVLYLGGISGLKGIVLLLRALQRVREEVPSLVCLMPGAEFHPARTGVPGLLRRAFSALGWRSRDEEIARRLFTAGRMDEYVRLMPFSRDVPSLLAAADVVVFPSVEPHFARPVMEAAAMARPVVASDIGGVNEIVDDGATGVLVPPGDAEALAGALTRVLRDEDGGAAPMGERAYRAARQLFDATENARRTIAVYDRLLAGRASDSHPGARAGKVADSPLNS
jgi:glycosyltransferase involved in cell wall biosynthesis